MLETQSYLCASAVGTVKNAVCCVQMWESMGEDESV